MHIALATKLNRLTCRRIDLGFGANAEVFVVSERGFDAVTMTTSCANYG
jgi:hypothetical protein